jgi:hypothetical protein
MRAFDIAEIAKGLFGCPEQSAKKRKHIDFEAFARKGRPGVISKLARLESSVNESVRAKRSRSSTRSWRSRAMAHR